MIEEVNRNQGLQRLAHVAQDQLRGRDDRGSAISPRKASCAGAGTQGQGGSAFGYDPATSYVCAVSFFERNAANSGIRTRMATGSRRADAGADMHKNAVFLIATALLCLVAGFAAGFLWRGGTTVPSTAPALPAPRESAQGLPANKAAPLSALPKEESPPASRPAPVVPDLELPAIPAGEHTVTVIVTDPDGNPVPGVVFAVQQDISALLSPTPLMGPTEDVAAHEAHMQALARHRDFNERLRNAATVTKATDANGEIVFAGLGTAKLKLLFRSSRYLINGKTSTLSIPVSPGSVLQYVVTETATILVRVSAADLGPKTRVHVVFKPAISTSSSTTKDMLLDAQTEIRLPAGRYSVHAYSASPRQTSPSVEVDVVAGQDVPVLELTLAAPVGIYGKIHWEGGTPNHVSMVGVRVTGNLSDEDLLREQRHVRSTPISMEANALSFSWEPGEPGDYLLAVKSRHRVLASQRVTLADVAMHIEFSIGLPSDRPVLTLAIESPSGHTVPEVQIETRALGKNASIEAELWRDRGKYLVVFGKGPEANRATRALVTASKSEYGTIRLDADTTVSSSASLKFQTPCEPHITIKGLPATTRRELRLVPLGPESNAGEIVVDEPSGPFAKRKVQPGHYRLLVRPELMWFELASVEVTLVAGKQDIELEVPPLSTIKLDGSACQAYTHATLEKTGTDTRVSVIFEKDFTAVVSLLPPGEYTIVYSSTKAGSRAVSKRHTFTLPGNELIVLPE